MVKLWTRLWFVLKNGLSPEAARKASDLGKEAIEKAKQGLEINYIDGPESTAALNLANAASALIQSLKGEQHAVVRLGPLLLVKCTENGVSRIATETMSPRLRRVLDENPRLLEVPHELFKVLQSHKDGTDTLIS